MIPQPGFQRGHFAYSDESGEAVTVPIDFNPATLDYTVTLNTQGEGAQAQQIAGRASARLNLELVFDSTDSGADVRSKTSRIERMLRPQEGRGHPESRPWTAPLVAFEWGAFVFSGVIESMRQSLEFFSPDGVPLRAVVLLTLSQPNYRFESVGGRQTRSGRNEARVVASSSAAQLAMEAGDPTAARQIAVANGLESLRTSTATLALTSDRPLGPPAGFSPAAPGDARALSGSFAALHRTETSFSSLDGRRLPSDPGPSTPSGAQVDVTGRAITPDGSSLSTNLSGGSLRFDPS